MARVMIRVPIALTTLQTDAKAEKRKRRSDYVPSSPSKNDFQRSSQQWKQFPSTTQAAFNSLSAKMQQAGLLAAGTKQTGYTLFMQMNRAALSLRLPETWASVPTVPAVPPCPPEFALAATDTGTRTVVNLTGPEFGVGCQVWLSDVFVPGCCDPFKRRMKMRGILPNGWPDGGISLSSVWDNSELGQFYHPDKGSAFVVKIVPVSAQGFVGPSLSAVCVVE